MRSRGTSAPHTHLLWPERSTRGEVARHGLRKLLWPSRCASWKAGACGSGRKVKHCCRQQRGPCEASLATAFLHAQRKAAAPDLAEALEFHDKRELVRALVGLAITDDAFLVPLPRLEPPALAPLRAALDRDDDAAAADALPGAVACCDTSVIRARLARAVIIRRDEAKLCSHIAAVALHDLTEARSLMVEAGLCEALAIRMGLRRTGSGLIVTSVVPAEARALSAAV